MQELRFAPFPVVAAPFGLVLGGGFETIGACDKIVAASESYIGLVEVGVGLIPGAGGNLRMILNAMDGETNRMGAFQKIQKTFETIGFAKVATSADEAKHLGLLKKEDTIYTELFMAIVNPEGIGATILVMRWYDQYVVSGRNVNDLVVWVGFLGPMSFYSKTESYLPETPYYSLKILQDDKEYLLKP